MMINIFAPLPPLMSYTLIDILTNHILTTEFVLNFRESGPPAIILGEIWLINHLILESCGRIFTDFILVACVYVY